MSAAPHILVVGAGPTGLTAAVELARLGGNVTIIEKRPTPSQLSRAVGIQVKSMDLLRPSGVADAIATEAIPFGGVAFHNKAKPLMRLPLNFSPETALRGLAQDRTEHHLVAALQRYGINVQYDTGFDGLVQDATGVTVTAGVQEKRYDYVIGADGAHSAVRRALGLDFPGFDLPGDWSIADVDCPDWPDPTWFKGYLLGQGNVAIVVPLERTRFRVIASLPDALAALPVPMAVSNVRRAAAFTISVRQVSDYNVGRVFLAGDAAHCHSPVGGRGMNLGIADAASLAGSLIAGDTSGYAAARHNEGQRVIAFSERGRRFVQAKSTIRRAALLTVMRTVGAVPPLGRFALNQFVNG